MNPPRCCSDTDALDPVPQRVERSNHRLANAAYLPSPNCDERPVTSAGGAGGIELIVIHNISLPPDTFTLRGAPNHIDALFQNRLDPGVHPYFETIHRLRVSAHVCIFRDGHIHQYVPFDQRAWHAGVSTWNGRERCNDFSIGIELEGCDTTPFTDAQYAALAATTRALLDAYPGLSEDAITGHSDIAPGRKTDPGPCFDWPRYRQMIRANA
jgi:AmpD protein